MSDSKIICQHCGKENSSTAINCKECGKALIEGLSPEELTTSLFWDSVEGGFTSDKKMRENLEPEEKIKYDLSEKYEIVKEVGRGGMAIIYKAIQKNLEREVALKVLPQHFTHDEEYLSRFHRESQEVAKLSHPNIITIYDEGEKNGTHFLAMEFLYGKDLQEKIKENGKLSPEFVVSTTVKIADALDYLHSKGLVHRDIKSSNIFITDEGRPVLMDFGIARTTGQTKLTQAGTIMGTPEYMSPEQAEGKELDGRSDLYGLGAVMYEALTGEVPFKADNPLTVIRKILDEPPQPARKSNSSVPKWLDELILISLSKNPNERFQRGKAFAQSLIEKKIILGEPQKQDFKTQKIILGSDTDKTQKLELSQVKEEYPSYSEKKKTKILIPVIAFLFLIVVGGYYFFFMKETSTDPANDLIKNTKTPIVTESSIEASEPKTDTMKVSTIPEDVETVKPASDLTEETVITKPSKVPDNSAKIASLKSQLQNAKSAENEALKKFEHAKKMRERKLISPSDFKKAENDYLDAKQKVENIENELSKL
ncbi:MAG: protein kinase [Melioribacteraceae bacterium]|nr:protein kinase [Melioribacteraceae bacterium]